MKDTNLDLSEAFKRMELYRACCDCACRRVVADLTTSGSLSNPLDSLSPDDTPYIARNTNPNFFWPLSQEFQRALSHLCASPNRVEKFIDAYAFPTGEGLNYEHKETFERHKSDLRAFRIDLYSRRASGVCVNANDHCVEHFAEYLTKLSRLDKSDEVARIYDRVLFLTGNYGEGKTIFVNFILSAFQDLFRKENCICIKIDYTDMERQGLDGLKDRLAMKSLRILKEKYFGDQTFSTASLRAYLVKGALSDSLRERTVAYFDGEITDPPVDPELGAYGLFIQVKKFIIEKYQHTFAFIIDGLDNFHRDIISEEKFVRRCAELADFVTSEHVYDSCYLIVMRDESHAYLRTQSHEGSVLRSQFRNVSLYHVPTETIIDAKFTLFQNFLASINNGSAEDGKGSPYEEGDRAVCANFLEVVDQFKRFLITYIKNSILLNEDDTERKHEEKHEEPFILNKLFNRNNRDIMAALTVIAHDLLMQIERSSHASDHIAAMDYLKNLIYAEGGANSFMRRFWYLALRSLMLVNYSFCLERFDYTPDDSSREKARKHIGPIIVPNMEGRSLIPNIFHVCDPQSFIGEDDHTPLGPYTRHFLIKLRIIQYFGYYTRKGQTRTFLEAHADLSEAFGYLKPWVLYECRMLYACQCVEKTHTKDSHDASRRAIRLSFLGNFILDELLGNYSYLESVVDNVSLPTSLCAKDFIPPTSLVRRTKHSGAHVSESEDFSLRLANKILRVLAFAEFIKQVDEAEMTIFKARTRKVYFSFHDNSKSDDLLIYPSMSAGVCRAVNRILGSDSPMVKTYTNEQLDRLIKEFLEKHAAECKESGISCVLERSDGLTGAARRPCVHADP